MGRKTDLDSEFVSTRIASNILINLKVNPSLRCEFDMSARVLQLPASLTRAGESSIRMEQVAQSSSSCKLSCF